MGNAKAKPRGFSVSSPPASPLPPPSPDIQNATTNDFLEAMANDIDDKKTANESPTPTATTPNDANSKAYVLKKKICAYNTNEFDDLFSAVATEIDSEYVDSTPSSQITANKALSNGQHSDSNTKLLYVPQIENIKLVFRYRKQLGKGGTCRVMMVESRKNKAEKFALKELSKHDKYNEELFAKEIQLLRLLADNVHVVDYYAAYQTKSYYYLALHFCQGGTFLDRILEMKMFSEKIAIKYIYTILSTIDYMHDRNIVHRDIKLNNMVFDKPGDDAILKIIDFGDSDIVEDHKSYKELVGTLYYLSPECKRTRKGWEVKKSDMWSFGVVCYILLCGKLPFSGTTQNETIKMIQVGAFEWPEEVELSESAKSFIQGLLCKDTAKRMSAKQALSHEFIVDYEVKANDKNILDRIKQFLRDFNYNNKLHQILVNACLEEIDDTEKNVIMEAFHHIDLEKKGNIDESDICRYLVLNSAVNKKYSKSSDAEKHAKHIFNVIEKTSNVGTIGITKSIPIYDFVQDISTTSNKNESSNQSKDDELKNESDGSGDDLQLTVDLDEVTIPVNTFKGVMSKSPKKYRVDDIVKELDPENTGFISFQSISKFKNAKMVKTISYEGQQSSDYVEDDDMYQ